MPDETHAKATYEELVERLEKAQAKAKHAKSQAAAPDYDEEAIRGALWAVVDEVLSEGK